MKALSLYLCLLFLSACVPHRPIVDYEMVGDSRKYEADLRHCQRIAKQGLGPAEGAVGGTILGGMLGAGLGAALGAVTGNASLGASYGGISGSAGGGVGGMSKGFQVQKKITANCMRGRGYTPLD